jgi:hypothetical protein
MTSADSDLHGHAGRLGILRHRKVNRDLDPDTLEVGMDT